MTRTRIKICGITRIEDVLACATYGVDAIGLVFYPPSARNLDLSSAQSIVAELPPFISVVGLFMNPEANQVYEVIDNVRIDILQFHGNERVDFCEMFDKPYFKAVPMSSAPEIDFRQLVREYSSSMAFLLDSHVKGRAGGTGRVFDWLKIPDNVGKPLILAGGLTPDNVRLGIEKSRPYAVDCSSGVESSPGIKDHRKIREFVENVRHVVPKK